LTFCIFVTMDKDFTSRAPLPHMTLPALIILKLSGDKCALLVNYQKPDTDGKSILDHVTNFTVGTFAIGADGVMKTEWQNAIPSDAIHVPLELHLSHNSVSFEVEGRPIVLHEDPNALQIYNQNTSTGHYQIV